MKKIIMFCLILVFGASLSAQTLSEDELRSIEGRQGEIIFENYVGPVSVINTREEIRGIGEYLASGSGTEVSWGNKYKIVRSYQPDITEGFDADILILLPDAGVDHIDNLRRILSAYIAATFGYDKSDADVLAEFVSYYNAVYYKNISYFNEYYKPGVLSHLNSDTAGLSTHYSEWAGKSRIVIPMATARGSMQSSLDTSEISSPDVVDEMQKEEDRALDSRRDMVEIREEELDERQNLIDEEKKSLAEDKDELIVQEESVQEEIEETQEALEEAPPGSEEEKRLEEELRDLEEEKKVVDEKLAEVGEKEDELEQAEDEIRKEQEEIVRMREEIAEDENELKEQGTVISSSPEEEPEGYWFVRIDRSGDPASFGKLIKVTIDGKVLQESELNSVRGTSFSDSGSGIIVIAGQNEGRSRVKAIILDSETLETKGESEEEIYPGSGIWTVGDNIFMICRKGQTWSLGKYAQDLKLRGNSELELNPDTGLVFVDDRILVQSSTGAVRALSADSLKLIETEE